MSINVIQAIPSQVAFPATPPSVIVGATMSPAVAIDIEDSSGAIVTTDNSNVTLTIASGPVGAALVEQRPSRLRMAWRPLATCPSPKWGRTR